MEQVTDLFEHTPAKTRVWITDEARKELDKLRVPDDLLALLLATAEKGFQEYRGPWIRKEGNEVWAFGPTTWTVRLVGYFPWPDRNHFVIAGVWKGKRGKGDGRPHQAEAIVNRILRIRSEGVKYVE